MIIRLIHIKTDPEVLIPWDRIESIFVKRNCSDDHVVMLP